MKIAFVVHDYSRGVGHGRYTVELAQRFSREHDVHIFANGIDRDVAGGAHVHRVPALRMNALATVVSFPLPATLAIGRDWDIIHAQGATSARFNVITAHICNAGWARAQRTARVARTWRQRVFEGVVTRFEHAVYRYSPNAQVIAISRRLRGELAEHYGRREHVDVIYHGVDTVRFAPSDAQTRIGIRRALGIAADAVVALFVGDLRKGAATALDVLSAIPGLALVAVSRSDPAPYRTRAKELGVADRVDFRAAIADIDQYYKAADFFLFPTPYDAFGMVISEAMACGLPVITAAQAGASELIAHGESGFVLDRPDDLSAMTVHARRLVVDPELRSAIGRRARAAVERHTWDDVARETMRVYSRASPLR